MTEAVSLYLSLTPLNPPFPLFSLLSPLRHGHVHPLLGEVEVDADTGDVVRRAVLVVQPVRA